MSGNDGVFLYIGIVTIWAGFLIPAWLRRPHASDADLEDDGYGQAQGYGQLGEPAADAGEPAGEAEKLDSHPLSPEYREHVPDYSEAESWPDTEPVARRSAAVRQPADVGMSSPATGSSPGTAPSQSRQQMLRARRRMLAILVALSLITGGFMVFGVVQWWICVPPIGMLVFYVLLLREIAMADAERASKRAALAASQARAARHEQVARQRRHAQWAAAAARPSAKIIDISGRVGDQLYDQYADAAVRAVGD